MTKEEIVERKINELKDIIYDDYQGMTKKQIRAVKGKIKGQEARLRTIRRKKKSKN